MVARQRRLRAGKQQELIFVPHGRDFIFSAPFSNIHSGKARAPGGFFFLRTRPAVFMLPFVRIVPTLPFACHAYDHMNLELYGGSSSYLRLGILGLSLLHSLPFSGICLDTTLLICNIGFRAVIAT